MTSSNSEGTPLLELETLARVEEDLDASRETEVTDDECHAESALDEPETGVSQLEQPSTSYHLSDDDHSQNSTSTLNSQLKKGREAYSYFAGEVLTSSSDSHKVSSAANSDECYVVEYTLDEDGNPDYVDINFDDTICEEDVKKLMVKLRMNHYTAISCEGDFMLSKCKGLFDRDYFCEVIPNHGGRLSRNYPARLIIPVARRSDTACNERLDAPDFDVQNYFSKVKKSVYSRLLTRFVVPVILFDKKFICRSGSLTVRKSAAFESARQKKDPKNVPITASAIQRIVRNLVGSLADFSSRTRRVATQLFVPNSMAKLRASDAEILRDLNIQHICDLMVEDRKMFKQTIRISSSEKINRGTFKDCAIEQMPYPGCSFFSRYHDTEYITDGLVFDWNRPDVNVEMQFSVDPYKVFPDINWAEYKEWDAATLTKNYLKMMLSFLVKDSGGMLIHCISGWDRTPLFISLLRMSLWADGLIHQSLDHKDMAYLTLAYDWYLFGHDLPHRLSKKQEILRFCFDFLSNIVSDEFSATRMFHELPADEKNGRLFREYIPESRRILTCLRSFVLEIYEEFITNKQNLN